MCCAAAATSAVVGSASIAVAAPPPAGLVGGLVGPALRAATAIAAAPDVALPSRYGPDTAIVVLGYGLRPDGSARPALVDRLRAGLVTALASSDSPVIVTGGNPRHGVTESDVMARWLIERGVPPERIRQDRDARTTLENASGAARVMGDLHARDAVLVTSAEHVPRAAADFVLAGVVLAATVTPEQIPPQLLSEL